LCSATYQCFSWGNKFALTLVYLKTSPFKRVPGRVPAPVGAVFLLTQKIPHPTVCRLPPSGCAAGCLVVFRGAGAFFGVSGYFRLGMAVFSFPGAFYGLLGHFLDRSEKVLPDGQAFAFPIGRVGLSCAGSPHHAVFSRTATPDFPKWGSSRGFYLAGRFFRQAGFCLPHRAGWPVGCRVSHISRGFPKHVDATPSNMRFQLTACGHLLEHDLRNRQALRKQSMAYHGGN
jgi:hypothetical protein